MQDTLDRPPALQTTLYDEATGTTGFVVADRLIGGQAMGGTRIAVGLTLDRVRDLARRMSLKLALAEVPIGGAKGGIALPADASDAVREQCVSAFGRLAGPLFRGGIYLGTDLGCTYAERARIHECAEYAVERQVPSLPCSWAELWEHCSDVTGYGVAHACAVAADALALGAGHRRVAIQGFGEVGKAVARYVSGFGLTPVAVADKHGTVAATRGLPLDQLLAITDERGTIDQSRLPPGVEVRNEPEAWLDIDADILVLAAVGDAVNGTNMGRVRSRIVVEGANAAVTDDAIAHLARAGCYVAPDIVANAGGAIACGLALLGRIPAGTTPQEAAAWLFEQTAQRVRANLTLVGTQAREQGRSLHSVAIELAQRRADAQRAR